MKLKWYVSGIVLLFSSATLLAQPGEKSADIDRLFSAWDRKDSPGCVVLVRQDGKTLHEGAYGMANLELGVPLSLSSVFLLASVSKQFVVFLIMMLAQGGRLSLDDDVRKHVPELPAFGKTITIRHLIHHTSGLREDLTSFNLAGWRTGDTITREDFFRFVTNQKELNFEPGDQYMYCNTGYHLLAIIVERVGQQSMPEQAQAKIFGSLGMKSTFVRDNHRTLFPKLAASYGQTFDALELPLTGLRKLDAYQMVRVAHDPPGASNVHSTVGDLARWDQNFYDATVGDKKLLNLMQTRAKLNDGKEITYAGGLHVDTYRGRKTVSHGGSHAGYKTVILRFPEQRFSVIILSNVREFVPMRMAKKVADICLRLEPESGVATVVAPGVLDSLQGEYRFGYSIRRVGLDKGGLFAQVDGGEKKRLYATSPSNFFDREDYMHYLFVKKKDGMILETTVEGAKSIGTRLRFIEPPAEKLAELAGTYRSAELGTFGSLEVGAGKLYLQLPREKLALRFLENGECIARAEDAFFSMLAVTFVRTNGVVTGYTLSTDRVRNLRYTKVKID